MYDLAADPLERTNLAHRGHRRTPEQERQYKRLRRKLARVVQTRLQPLSY
jgi:choline-sulfatase